MASKFREGYIYFALVYDIGKGYKYIDGRKVKLNRGLSVKKRLLPAA
jgi:hypothetical protein